MRTLTEKQKKALLVTGITAAVYISLKYILPFVIPFFLSYGIACLINPAAETLQKKFHIKKGLTAVVLISFLMVGLLFFAGFLGRLLVGQISGILEKLPESMRSASAWLENICCDCDRYLGITEGTSEKFLYSRYRQMAGVLEEHAGNHIMENSGKILAVIVKMGAGIAVIVISSVFLVTSMGRIRHYRNVSVFRQEIAAIAGCLSRTGKAFFCTQIFIMGLTSVVCSVGLWILGNPYALLLGILIGFLDFLPVFGTGTVLIPWAIGAWLFQRWDYGIGLLVLYALCYFLREVAEAKLMGGKIGIPPLEMLISIYVGFKIFGITGLILGPFGLMVIRELLSMYERKAV